jgi:hypothetical protein
MRWLLILYILTVIFSAPGRSDASYQIHWHTIDSGGGTSSGGQYVLTGTIGQPDAAYSAGGNYALCPFNIE